MADTATVMRTATRPPRMAATTLMDMTMRGTVGVTVTGRGMARTNRRRR